jgi:hypothetical protein
MESESTVEKGIDELFSRKVLGSQHFTYDFTASQKPISGLQGLQMRNPGTRSPLKLTPAL